MAVSAKTVAVGVGVAAAALAAWLFLRPVPSEPVPETAASGRGARGPATLENPARPSAGLDAAAHVPKGVERIRIHATSECGGSVPAVVIGFGAEDRKTKARRIREVVAGPGGVDGLVTLGAAPLGGRREGESLHISAPGYETKELSEDVLAGSDHASVIEVALEKETRIIGEMTWPATWPGHVRPQDVVIGRAPEDPKAQWTARPLALEEDGRTFHGTVRGCGRFQVVFYYVMDDLETGDLATVEIDANSGPEVHVAMVPSAGHGDPDIGPLFRWTIHVVDSDGAPVEGATITATRTHERGGRVWMSSVPGEWMTNRSGEGLRESHGGRYYFTVRKGGWGTAVGDVTLDRDHRDEVRLAPARTRLIVNLTWTGTGATDAISVELRVRADPKSGWDWQPLETKGSGKSPAQLEFPLAEGSEYAVFATGRDLAPVVVSIAKVGAEEKERTLDVVLDGGERVELHGLEQEPIGAEIPIQIQHEGLVGEMMTVTKSARFAAGKWTIDHVGAEGGEVSASFDGRKLRGHLQAAGRGARIVELR